MTGVIGRRKPDYPPTQRRFAGAGDDAGRGRNGGSTPRGKNINPLVPPGAAVAVGTPKAGGGGIVAALHRKYAEAGLAQHAQGVAPSGQQLGLHAQQVLAVVFYPVAKVQQQRVGAGQWRGLLAGHCLEGIQKNARIGPGG